MILIKIFLSLLGIYFLVGFLFGLYFITIGATKIDPLMKDTKKKVRFLLFFGVLATWPFLVHKLKTLKTP